MYMQSRVAVYIVMVTVATVEIDLGFCKKGVY